jgi:putative phosphoribosyl transferase
MYFASRFQAGRLLAEQITEKYRYENCAVMALGDGGVMVGAQIAAQLHCVMMLLETAEIFLPREPQAIAGMTPGGAVAYNSSYSQGEIDELVGENYGLIEQEKLTQMRQLNELLGSAGLVNKRLLSGHNVIVVSDGLKTPFPVELAAEFLKPVDIASLVAAVPFASVPAVDRLHVLADDLYCLSVIPDYIDTDHYYDKQDVPDHATVLKTIEHIVMNWK